METEKNLNRAIDRKNIEYYGKTMISVRNLEGDELRKFLHDRIRLAGHLMRNLPDIDNSENPEDLALACEDIGKALYQVATCYLAWDDERYAAYCECTAFFKLPDSLRTRFIFIHDKTKAAEDIPKTVKYIMQHQYVLRVARDRTGKDVAEMRDAAWQFLAYVGDEVGLTMDDLAREKQERTVTKTKRKVNSYNTAVRNYRNSVVILNYVHDLDNAASQLAMALDQLTRFMLATGNLNHPEYTAYMNEAGKIYDRVMFIKAEQYFSTEKAEHALVRLYPLYQEGVRISDLKLSEESLQDMQECMTVLLEDYREQLPEELKCHALVPVIQTEPEDSDNPALKETVSEHPEGLKQYDGMSADYEHRKHFTKREIILGVALVISLILNVILLII